MVASLESHVASFFSPKFETCVKQTNDKSTSCAFQPQGKHRLLKFTFSELVGIRKTKPRATAYGVFFGAATSTKECKREKYDKKQLRDWE